MPSRHCCGSSWSRENPDRGDPPGDAGGDRPAYLFADLPDPDLIIRTSGELRLSGFLLWQSTTSEFYFSEVNWPAFRRIDFLRAIRSFQGRSRRYGL